MVVVPTGKGLSYIIATKEVAGPSSYATGGFTVEFPELSKVHDAIVSLETAGNAYRAVYSVANNAVTIQVYELKSTTSGITADEVAAGTDLSALKFKVLVIGE